MSGHRKCKQPRAAIKSYLVEKYRRLFVSPTPKPAPPQGFVYTNKECVVFGLTTLDLRARHQPAGLKGFIAAP